MPRKTFALALALSSTLTAGCAGFSAVYPPRPPETPGEAIADPTPAKVVMHLTVTAAGLKSAIEENLPQTGEGTFPLLGKDRTFTWKRTPATLRFTQGRIGLELHVDAVADLPVSSLEIGHDFKILAE